VLKIMIYLKTNRKLTKIYFVDTTNDLLPGLLVAKTYCLNASYGILSQKSFVIFKGDSGRERYPGCLL
jgi:hypothetical protein